MLNTSKVIHNGMTILLKIISYCQNRGFTPTLSNPLGMGLHKMNIKWLGSTYIQIMETSTEIISE